MNRLGLVGLLLVFATAEAVAQPVSKPVIDVGAGIAIPFNPEAFTDGWNSGFSGRIGLGVQMTPIMTLQGSLDYNRLSFDDEAIGVPGVTVDGGTATILYVSGGVKVTPTGQTPQPAHVYLAFGAGFYRISVSDARVSGGGSSTSIAGAAEDALGFNFGGGISVSPFYLEGLYLHGLTEGESTGLISVRVGVSFVIEPGKS